MVAHGVDFSWARPGAQNILDAGFTFVIRYIPYPGDGGKGLTKDELNGYRAANLDVVLVFESTANRPLSGFTGGTMDGATVQTAVKNLGFPQNLPVYFAVDFDAQPAELASIDEYLQGAATVLGKDRIGVYGSYRVIEHCHDVGTAKYLWQALAWSGGKHFPLRHIYQSLNGQTINGGAVDYNEAYFDDFGQWPAERDQLTKAEVEELVKKTVDTALSYQFRLLTRAYWDRTSEGAYTDPPEPEVVQAIAQEIGIVGYVPHDHNDPDGGTPR